LQLTGDETYSTDVADKYVREPAQDAEIVSGSRAVTTPYSSYIAVAAELGLLGLMALVGLYGSALFITARRTFRAAQLSSGVDALPVVLLTSVTALFLLIQMGALENWLEVSRLTFIVWGLLAIANREYDESYPA
jgi:hypothetical protein